MMTTKAPAPLLTPKEAAARLAITVDQLHQLVSDGEIAYIAVGRGQKRPRRRFTDADLEAFIERRRRREVFLPPNRKRSRTDWNSDSRIVGFTARLAAEKLEKRKRGQRTAVTALSFAARSGRGLTICIVVEFFGD